MLVRALLLVGIVASHATAETLKAPKCGPAKTPPAKVRTVKDVDWCNFDIGFWKGPLRQGHAEVHLYADMGQPHDTIAASLRGVIYGDYNGDKVLDAAVVIESSTWIGKTGDHSGGTSVHMYTLASGKPTSIGSIPAGTPVDAITLGKGIVTIVSGPKNAKATMRFRRGKSDFEEVKATKSSTP